MNTVAGTVARFAIPVMLVLIAANTLTQLYLQKAMHTKAEKLAVILTQSGQVSKDTNVLLGKLNVIKQQADQLNQKFVVLQQTSSTMNSTLSQLEKTIRPVAGDVKADIDSAGKIQTVVADLNQQAVQLKGLLQQTANISQTIVGSFGGMVSSVDTVNVNLTQMNDKTKMLPH